MISVSLWLKSDPLFQDEVGIHHYPQQAPDAASPERRPRASLAHVEQREESEDRAAEQADEVPRQEPDDGELNYAYLFGLLDELDYTGWVGCEYRPRAGALPGGTTQGLGWRQPWL